MQPVQFPYIETDPQVGSSSRRPLLPLSLILGQQSITVLGLLDTRSTINVLPYSVGLQLGAIWDQQTISLALTGNLATLEARALALFVVVASFPPVELLFAWCKSNSPPVILGETNFFLEFDVCFFRSKSYFEIKPC